MRNTTKKINFKKYINGSKGVISLMLAMVMLPFVMIAGALVSAARINSAVAIFDEALCNASNSVLGTYDTFIRDRFGLLCISQDISSNSAKVSNPEAVYSTDDFISDMFAFYMEQNECSLSNTYNSSDVSAAGLYPLSDYDVLYSSITQASKITVPAKIAIDWTSLDDIMNELTKGLKVFSSLASTASSAFDVASDLKDIEENADTLKEELDSCTTARTEYINAYNSFSSAITDYNSQIDKVANLNAQVNNEKQSLQGYSTAIQDAEEEITSLEDQIKAWKEDKDSNGKKIDHSEEIEEAEERIEEIEEENGEALQQYEEASKQLSKTQSAYNTAKNQISSYREKVNSTKQTYLTKIKAFHSALKAAGEAAVEYQGSLNSLKTDSVSIASGVISTTFETVSSVKNKQVKDLEEQNESLTKVKGQTTDAEEIEAINATINSNEATIDSKKADIIKNSNYQTVVEGAVDSVNTYLETEQTLLDKDFTKSFGDLCDKLYKDNDPNRTSLYARVYDTSVPSNDNRMSYGTIYETIEFPTTKEEVQKAVDDLEDSLCQNGGIAMIKAVVGFVTALFKLEVIYDTDLTTTVDTSLYTGERALPSKINRDAYPIESEYLEADSAKSDEYKRILNSYSDSIVYSDVADIPSVGEQIKQHFCNIQTYLSNFSLKNLYNAMKEIKEILSLIVNEVATAIKNAVKTAYERFLLSGYISYNTANRTTYSGKALTGASYNLPMSEASDGYCFSGAETEYIIIGTMSEQVNQTAVFYFIWILRSFIDIYAVMADPVITSVATALGSVSFGILTVVTYVVFIYAEAFVDTLLLVNGAQIPILKTVPFLTPAGLPSLVTTFSSLKLSKALKESIYNKSVDCCKKIEAAHNEDHKVSTYSDYETAEDKVDNYQKKILNKMFQFDYTKTLQILMIALSNQRMLSRLADIIQMEASYNAHKGIITYDFMLDKSYTYIRASGSFDSDLFMQISDATGFTSTERIIYRGY